MKNTIKTILLFFMAAFVLTSCSDDDKNPPTAGFSLSNMDPFQWDTSTIASTADAAEEVSYTVTGGEFVWVDGATIQFLEDHSYTITQTAVNGDGTDTSSLTIDVIEPNNTYKMGFYSDENHSVNGNAYWFESFGTLQIRFEASGATSQETDNLVKVTPIAGADPIYGTGTRTYTWSDSGDIDTYNGAFTHYPETGDAWDAAWFTSTAGGGLEITLVYDAAADGDDVYDIKMSSTTLEGYYDPMFSFNDGEGSLVLTYRGTIDAITP